VHRAIIVARSGSGMVGKYVSMPDAYMSVVEALRSPGSTTATEVELDWIDAEKVRTCSAPTASARSMRSHSVVACAGRGMVAAASYAANHPVPRAVSRPAGHGDLGARDWAGSHGPTPVNSTSLTPDPVIDLMPDQTHVTDKGAPWSGS